MQTLHKAKIETEIGNYALRKSTKVEVIDEKLILKNTSILKLINL